MDSTEARKRLQKWIEDKHTVLWLDWDVSKPKDLDKCLDYMCNMMLEAGIIVAGDTRIHLLDRTDVEGISLDEVVNHIQGFLYYAKKYMQEYALAHGRQPENLTAEQAQAAIKKTPRYVALAIRLTT